MEAPIPQPGELIAGRLLVEKVLGKGGMGVVLAARHTELGERVAVKMLRLPSSVEGRVDERAVERLRREARAAAKLRGEHVVRVMDVGTLESGPVVPPTTGPPEPPDPGHEHGGTGAARFVPLPPTRLVDTRTGLGAPQAPVPDGGTLEVTARDVLKSAPRGYPKDHPRIELLRYKGLITWRDWPVAAWLGTARARDRIVAFLEASKPLNAWLRSNVGPSTIPERRR